MSAYLTWALSQSTLLLFFKKSRSIFSSATSRLSRATSLCSSLIGFPWLPTLARVPSLAALTQYVIGDFGIDNLRATSGAFHPSSVIIRTASSRSSFVQTALGIRSMILTPPSLQCTSTLVSTKNILSQAQEVACQGKNKNCIEFDQGKGTIRLGQEFNVRQLACNVSVSLFRVSTIFAGRTFRCSVESCLHSLGRKRSSIGL